MKKSMPRVLYHYCSLATFKSILDNKVIWLSDIRKSNDSLELQWIMEQCGHYILKAWLDYAESVQKERGSGVVTSKHFEQFEQLYNLIRKYDAEIDTKTWAFCLSQKGDDLGQWRGYADDGHGVALGINSATLSSINLVGDNIRSTTESICFERVKYTKPEIEHLFYDVAELSKINADMRPDQALQCVKRAVGLSFMLAPFYKNYKFKAEEEWRIVYSMDFSDLVQGKKPGILNERNIASDIFTLDKYAFSQNGGDLVSHLEMGLPQIKRAIHSITIGPKAKCSILDIKLYLMSIGLLEDVTDVSVEVKRSNISYR